MTGVVEVRGVQIGKDMPKICVPVLGITREEILTSAGQAVSSGADVIEWRADWFLKGRELKEQAMDELKIILADIRKLSGEVPILFTIRTAGEGGEMALEGAEYEQANRTAIASGNVDLIDIELSQGETQVSRMIAAAHEAGVKVVVSSHDFSGTPEKEDLVCRLLIMKRLGADLPKLAVMPKDGAELLRLLAVTQEVSGSRQLGPVITMSMGRIGMPSRCLGESFGSALTFASAGQASAPGQIPVKDLRILLEMLHKYSGYEA